MIFLNVPSDCEYDERLFDKLIDNRIKIFFDVPRGFELVTITEGCHYTKTSSQIF